MSGETTGSVQIGTFTLQVGGAGGTVVQPGSTPATEGTSTLAQALVEPKPKEPTKVDVAAETVEDAAGVTAKCERAVTLGKGVSEGKVFDPAQLGAEVGALLDLLEKLDRNGRHKEALKIARALATLLMLLRRWQMLLQTLRTALGAAEKLGDLDATAWARNELGALRLAAGDVKGAERDLHQAREIREKIGDRRGLAATNRNLQALCKQLQQMVRREELVRSGAERDEGQMRDESRRPSFLRLLILAVLCVLFFAAGVLAGNSGGTGRQTNFHGGEPTTPHPHPRPKPKPNPQPKPHPNSQSFPLTIAIEGVERGEVLAAGEKCVEPTCTFEIPADESVTLEAVAFEGYVFAGFSGICEGANPCTLTMAEAQSVTATFTPIEEEEEEEETTEEEFKGPA